MDLYTRMMVQQERERDRERREAARRFAAEEAAAKVVREHRERIASEAEAREALRRERCALSKAAMEHAEAAALAKERTKSLAVLQTAAADSDMSSARRAYLKQRDEHAEEDRMKRRDKMGFLGEDAFLAEKATKNERKKAKKGESKQCVKNGGRKANTGGGRRDWDFE